MCYAHRFLTFIRRNQHLGLGVAMCHCQKEEAKRIFILLHYYYSISTTRKNNEGNNN